MHKRTITLVLCFLIVCSMIIPVSMGYNVRNTVEHQPSTISNGRTIYVGGNGPGNYSKIQDAINNAIYGITVFVYSGIYYENIRIELKINLIGENKEDTIIIGSGNTYTIVITANRVKISDFTIKNNNTNLEFAGIIVNSDLSIITNNIFIECGGHGLASGNVMERFHGNLISENEFIDNGVHGIYLYNTKDCIISNNTIYENNALGMRITYSENTRIIGNTITYNSEDGIEFWDSHNSIVDSNEISYNGGMGIFSWTHSSKGTFKNNNFASNAEDGIFITDSGSFLIEKNTISSNGRNGIGFAFSNKNIIQRNEIIGNNIGLELLDGSSNDIIQNNFSDNDVYGIKIILHFWGSQNNEFYNNNFRGNTVNANDECTNIWYNEYNSIGNYWDNYTGEDNDCDGIGDTPHPIPDNNNEDKFPLMIPLCPPYKPKIVGPPSGKSGIAYNYTFCTNDVNDDNISYFIDWGDGTNSGWTKYLISGDEITLNHTWSNKDTFIISCKAKDIFGAESDWGTFKLTIPKTRMIFKYVWFRFLDIFPTLERILGLIR